MNTAINANSKLRVLLTGGSGFVGGFLSKLLSEKGVLVANIGRKKSIDPCFHESVLNTFDEIKRVIDEFKPSFIINLAAENSKNLEDVVSANVILPANILEVIAALKNPPVFIQLSTYWQLGDEGKPEIPIDLYSSSKKAFMSFLDYYNVYQNVPICNIFLYGTYGNNDTRGKLLDQLIRAVACGESLGVSPGLQKLNLLHVQDVCNVICSFIEKWKDEYSGKKYALYDKDELTLHDIVEKIERLSGKKSQILFGELPYRSVELMNPRYVHPLPPFWRQEYTIERYIKESLILIGK